MSEERDPRAEHDLDDDWKVVRIVGTDEEADLIAGYLQANDVGARVESLLFHQDPVNFGGLGEVRVRVPVEQEAVALRLLAERELDPLDEEAEAAEIAGETAASDGGAGEAESGG